MPETPEYLGLAKAARHFPVDGKNPNPTTPFRWMKNGVRRGGQVIHLRHTYIGARIVTTKEWINEFISALEAASMQEVVNAAPVVTPPPSKKRTKAQRNAAIRKAEAELIKAGC